MADTIDPCQMYRNLNQHRRSSLSFSESKEQQDQNDCDLKSNKIRSNSLDSNRAMVKSILKSSCLRKKACLKAAEQVKKVETEKRSVCFARQASVTDTYSPENYDEDGQLKECCVEKVDVKESYLSS